LWGHLWRQACCLDTSNNTNSNPHIMEDASVFDLRDRLSNVDVPPEEIESLAQRLQNVAGTEVKPADIASALDAFALRDKGRRASGVTRSTKLWPALNKYVSGNGVARKRAAFRCVHRLPYSPETLDHDAPWRLFHFYLQEASFAEDTSTVADWMCVHVPKLDQPESYREWADTVDKSIKFNVDGTLLKRSNAVPEDVSNIVTIEERGKRSALAPPVARACIAAAQRYLELVRQAASSQYTWIPNAEDRDAMLAAVETLKPGAPTQNISATDVMAWLWQVGLMFTASDTVNRVRQAYMADDEPALYFAVARTHPSATAEQIRSAVILAMPTDRQVDEWVLDVPGLLPLSEVDEDTKEQTAPAVPAPSDDAAAGDSTAPAAGAESTVTVKNLMDLNLAVQKRPQATGERTARVTPLLELFCIPKARDKRTGIEAAKNEYQMFVSMQNAGLVVAATALVLTRTIQVHGRGAMVPEHSEDFDANRERIKYMACLVRAACDWIGNENDASWLLSQLYADVPVVALKTPWPDQVGILDASMTSIDDNRHVKISITRAPASGAVVASTVADWLAAEVGYTPLLTTDEQTLNLSLASFRMLAQIQLNEATSASSTSASSTVDAASSLFSPAPSLPRQGSVATSGAASIFSTSSKSVLISMGTPIVLNASLDDSPAAPAAPASSAKTVTRLYVASHHKSPSVPRMQSLGDTHAPAAPSFIRFVGTLFAAGLLAPVNTSADTSHSSGGDDDW
jgi:hypothetical protein